MQAVERLLAAGAKPQRKTETGAGALQCAAESGSFSVFSHMLKVRPLCLALSPILTMEDTALPNKAEQKGKVLSA